MVAILPAIADALCLAGLAQQGIGSALVRTPEPFDRPAVLPPITVLKPLHGDEALLDAALESFFLIDYPVFQLVFGAENPADPALAIVARLRRRYPAIDAVVIVGPTPSGRNRKVANLIAMLPAARHDLLVISDADMHVPPDYLNAVAATMARPGTGLATTLYTGLPATASLPAILGAAQINHLFLPGAALARRLGRQDCLGATMAISRTSLAAIGGLESLLDHLADDNVLGRLTRVAGQNVALAPSIPATSVTESSFAALLRHELRWARTIRALVPATYWGLALQFPLFWASIAMILTGFSTWTWLFLALAAGIRYALARQLERRLGLTGPGTASPGLANTAAPWLFLLRDWLSAAIFVASFWSDTVEWRGHLLQADSGAAKPSSPESPPRVYELGSMR